MDEVSFGPGRERRRPSRRRPALAVGASIAGAVAALAVMSAHHPTNSRQSAGCAPAHAAWPNLAGLPAGMRPGAMPVIIDAQFSGRCPAP
jgi:hypothetical protein